MARVVRLWTSSQGFVTRVVRFGTFSQGCVARVVRFLDSSHGCVARVIRFWTFSAIGLVLSFGGDFKARPRSSLGMLAELIESRTNESIEVYEIMKISD